MFPITVILPILQGRALLMTVLIPAKVKSPRSRRSDRGTDASMRPADGASTAGNTGSIGATESRSSIDDRLCESSAATDDRISHSAWRQYSSGLPAKASLSAISYAFARILSSKLFMKHALAIQRSTKSCPSGLTLGYQKRAERRR